MAKVVVVTPSPVPQPPPTVEVTLSITEAKAIRHLLGKSVRFEVETQTADPEQGRCLYPLYKSFSNALKGL